MRGALCTDLHSGRVCCMRKLCQKYLKLQREYLFLFCFGFARICAAFSSARHSHVLKDLTTTKKVKASRIWAWNRQSSKTCSL